MGIHTNSIQPSRKWHSCQSAFVFAPRSNLYSSSCVRIAKTINTPTRLYDFHGHGSASHEPSSIFIAAKQTGQSFEAVAPDTSILVGFGVVVLLSMVAAYVWANEVVPVSRTKLALSKRDGEVKKYLDELKEGATRSQDTDKSSSESTDGASFEANETVNTDGRDFERWLFTDWLQNNKSAGKPGKKKQPALPILKSAKWNSGDNPVLVTFALMMIGVVIASITERTGGSF